MYTTSKKSPAVVEVRCGLARRRDWEIEFLLTADRHWDNPNSRWDLQRRHLDEAQEKGCGVLDFGDFFCAMQGKYDKRASKSKVRPEHNVDNYLDALVTTAADFFAPYASRFILIGRGNHETAICKRNETDLTERIVGVLNDRTKSNVIAGGYGGWVIFKFVDGNATFTIKMKYHHGYGGSSPVTRGVIHSARRAVYLPDADIVVSGHLHQETEVTIVRERVTSQGRVFKDNQVHIQVPTYKDSYGDGSHGWEIEKGFAPSPVGAVWLRFWFDTSEDRIKFDTRKAQ